MARHYTDIQMLGMGGHPVSFKSIAKRRPINIYHRISVRVGWIALFSGESRGKALERVLPELNAKNYRVSFVIPDSYSILGRLWNVILLCLTLGFYSRSANFLVIGERIDLLQGEGKA